MNDFDEAEEIYKSIGQLLHKALPESWDEASITFILNESDVNNTNLVGEYISHNETNRISFNPADVMKLTNHFKELYELTKKEGTKHWTEALLTLAKNGHFKMNFKYPD